MSKSVEETSKKSIATPMLAAFAAAAGFVAGAQLDSKHDDGPVVVHAVRLERPQADAGYQLVAYAHDSKRDLGERRCSNADVQTLNSAVAALSEDCKTAKNAWAHVVEFRGTDAGIDLYMTEVVLVVAADGGVSEGTIDLGLARCTSASVERLEALEDEALRCF